MVKFTAFSGLGRLGVGRLGRETNIANSLFCISLTSFLLLMIGKAIASEYWNWSAAESASRSAQSLPSISKSVTHAGFLAS